MNASDYNIPTSIIENLIVIINSESEYYIKFTYKIDFL